MRAVFLDRDGVICQNRSDHVKNWAEFQFLPEAKTGLAALNQLDLPVVVVTNQAIINRGLVTASVVEDIHQRMVAELSDSGGRIDRIIYCPHRPDEGCNCRKPESGMLLQAAEDMGIDLVGSYLVGDAAPDLIAGSRVGCHPYLVLTGRGPNQIWPAFQTLGGRFTIARNLRDAANHIINNERCIAFRLDRGTLSVSSQPW